MRSARSRGDRDDARRGHAPSRLDIELEIRDAVRMRGRRRIDEAMVAIAAGAMAACGDATSPAVDATVDTTAADRGETPPTANFSFFVTSLRALQELSGSADGFGGDLRFGETGPGAGLRGADKLCRTIAERSQVGAGARTWRAFLSVADGGDGQPVHAIDRIGPGPWHDRLGRMLAPDVASLMALRPQGGDPTIRDDFPNEDGVRNHDPDLTGEVDNHDMLTGTDSTGRLEGPERTCLDWTAATGDRVREGQPRVGHSWPRPPPDLQHGAPINSWMSSLIESGCAPGVNLADTGPPDPDSNTVGSGGGYGGFYCFAIL